MESVGIRVFSLILLLIQLPSLSQANATPISLGTTLVAIKYEDGVVVAADTRTSMSTYVSHRFAHKIVPVNHHVVLCRSGSSAATQWLAECLSQVQDEIYHKWDEQLSVCQVAHWLRREMKRTNVEGASLLVAGYDAEKSEPRIFTVAQSGALLETFGPYAAAGSGSTLVTGYLDQEIKTKENLSEQRAVELCKNAVQLAIDRDGSSGGLIRLCIVSKEGRREQTIHPDHDNPEKDQKSPVDLRGFASRPKQQPFTAKLN